MNRIPIFRSTSEAIAFGAEMTRSTMEFLEVRRKYALDSAKVSADKGEIQRALNEIVSAQFDREAIESFQGRIHI